MENPVNSPCLRCLECLFRLNHSTVENENDPPSQSTPTETNTHSWTEFGRVCDLFSKSLTFVLGVNVWFFSFDFKIFEDNFQKLGLELLRC